MSNRFTERNPWGWLLVRLSLPMAASTSPIIPRESSANVISHLLPTFRAQCAHSRAVHGRCGCSLLVFCCLMGARTSGSRGFDASFMPKACYSSDGRVPDKLASILETAEGAAYSSLRRKKSQTESGERILRKQSTPRCERAGLACGAISGWNLACVESKHDSVT